MTIRIRIALLFTLLAAAILLIFATIVYLSAKKDREREFYALLKKEAITKANLILDARVEAGILQNIYRSNRATLNEVEVAVYDIADRLLYHDAVDIDVVKETPDMLEQIRRKGSIEFFQGDWQVIGMRYIFDEKPYLLTAAALDQYGYSKLDYLFRTSVAVFLFAVAAIFLAGRFFARKTLEPVHAMTEKAQNISATNLNLRLSAPGQKDELSRLADTFNAMLDRLEESFDAQKRFVSHVAHELRTPLSSMTAELELAASKSRQAHEYKTVIQDTLRDARKMARLTTSLLDLAKASYDPAEIAFKSIRVDEILLDARQQVLQAHPTYHVELVFGETPEEEAGLSMMGNSYLLQVAFVNLIENGCKFSPDRTCRITIDARASRIRITFADQGPGILEEDLEHIFTPFYRGANAPLTEGHGIGLPLARKIAELHQSTLEVVSTPGAGTQFMLDFAAF